MSSSPPVQAIARRALQGLPYEFTHAVENRLYGHRPPDTKGAEGIAVEATMVLILDAHRGGTDAHVHRALEAALPAYHLWRGARRLAAVQPAADTASRAA